MSDELSDTPGSSATNPELERVLRFFDGDLSAAELAEFNAQLRDDAASRRRFAAYCTRSCLIRETFGPETQALQRREPYVRARVKSGSYA